jgi:hypothetical protein
MVRGKDYQDTGIRAQYRASKRQFKKTTEQV